VRKSFAKIPAVVNDPPFCPLQEWVRSQKPPPPGTSLSGALNSLEGARPAAAHQQLISVRGRKSILTTCSRSAEAIRLTDRRNAPVRRAVLSSPASQVAVAGAVPCYPITSSDCTKMAV